MKNELNGNSFEDSGSNFPKDDVGIREEQVLDICDHIISRCWREIFESENNKKISLEDLEKILNLANNSWVLATDILRDDNEEEFVFDENEDIDNEDEEEDGEEA
jgi:hypothetical protein